MNIACWVLVAAATAGATESFDHGHGGLAQVLSGAVSEAGVDYGVLGTRRAALARYLDALATADLTTWSETQKLAFWVNAYNAHTVALVLDNQPLTSIRDLDGGDPWNTRFFTVAGEKLTLNQMEHERARPLSDGRVHAVLNCASRGCPPLPSQPLVASTVSEQLDAGVRLWVRTNAYRRSEDLVSISPLFAWYSEDFTSYNEGDLLGVEEPAESALWFLARYVDGAERARLTSGTVRTDVLPYDWSLNDQ